MASMFFVSDLSIRAQMVFLPFLYSISHFFMANIFSILVFCFSFFQFLVIKFYTNTLIFFDVLF